MQEKLLSAVQILLVPEGAAQKMQTPVEFK